MSSWPVTVPGYRCFWLLSLNCLFLPLILKIFFVAVVASAALCIHVYRCMALTVKHLPFIVMTFPLIIYFCLPLGVATLKFSWLLFYDVTFQLVCVLILKWTFAALMWLGNAFREFSLLVLVF